MLERAALCLSLFVSVLATAPTAMALDDSKAPVTEKEPLAIFRDPRQAMTKYIEGYRSGDTRSSLEALRYAADGGEALARWKLGSMYAQGDGVPRDDLKAYQYFQQIIDAYDEANPNPRERGVVASAFVAVGAYALNGKGKGIERDTARATVSFLVKGTTNGMQGNYTLTRQGDKWGGVTRQSMTAAPHGVEPVGGAAPPATGAAPAPDQGKTAILPVPLPGQQQQLPAGHPPVSGTK